VLAEIERLKAKFQIILCRGLSIGNHGLSPRLSGISAEFAAARRARSLHCQNDPASPLPAAAMASLVHHIH
jgi:hypothetical protein